MLPALNTDLSVKNWCGTHDIAAMTSVITPRDESEVRHAIRESKGSPRIQVLGNRYSWPELIASDDGVVIDTTQLSGIIAIGPDTIEVYAGTPLHEIHAALACVNRRPAYSPPVITRQTIGGAIATGTHGQGMASSTIGDAILELSVIDASGALTRIGNDHPDLGAYQLNLGCLGIVTRVTLPTVPNRPLTCEKRAVPYRTFLAEFPKWQREYAYSKAWWFPDDGKSHVWLIRAPDYDETRAFYRHNREPVSHGAPNGTMNDVVSRATNRIRTDTITNDLSAGQFRTVRRFGNFTNVTGFLDDLVCKGIPVPQINCEIGIPLANFEEAQDRLEQWYRTRKPSMHYPFILRATGPSTAWMSPAYNRDTCYYGMLVYQASDGSFSGTSYAALRGAQTILADCSGLPHWGKYFDPHGFDFDLLPRWSEFLAVRSRVDPQAKFFGPYISSILCHESRTLGS